MTNNDKISKAYYPDYSKDAHERSIQVFLKDKQTGEILGSKYITRGELARRLQPFGRSCHGAIQGKFIIEI